MLKLCRSIKPEILNQTRRFSMAVSSDVKTTSNLPREKGESARMKKFHEKLKLEKMPTVAPGIRFADLVLVDINPDDGELIPDSEKNPTKWGDWQHGGRVTDF